MTGAKYVLFSSSSTFSSSDTSSTPAAFPVEVCGSFAGLFPLKTKPNCLDSVNFGTSGSAGFAGVAIAFGEPNEKLNVEDPNAPVALVALELLAVFTVLTPLAVEAAGFCAAAKLPKLNFGAPAKSRKNYETFL